MGWGLSGKMAALEQASEILLKLGIGSGGSCVARDDDHVVSVGKRFSMRAQEHPYIM